MSAENNQQHGNNMDNVFERKSGLLEKTKAARSRLAELVLESRDHEIIKCLAEYFDLLVEVETAEGEILRGILENLSKATKSTEANP